MIFKQYYEIQGKFLSKFKVTYMIKFLKREKYINDSYSVISLKKDIFNYSHYIFKKIRQ